MPKGIGLKLNLEFKELQEKENALRERTIREINSLVEQTCIEKGATRHKKFAIAIEDGPSRVSAWDDEVDEVIIGVAHGHVIYDEAGNISVAELKDVSTESLIDAYIALETEVDNQTAELEDYSDEIK